MRSLQIRRVARGVAFFLAGALGGASVAGADGPIVIDANTKAKKGLYPLAVPAPTETHGAGGATRP